MENVRGAILMSLAMAGFAIEDMFIKLTKDFGMPTGQVLAVLGLMGGMVYWAFMAHKGIPLITRKLTDRGVMIRNLGEFVGTGCYVLAFTGGALSSASAVMQALPLFVTMGAAIFLGQQVGWRRWTAIGIGFIGVLMVIQPGGENFDPYLALAFVGVLGMAGRDVQTRALHGEIHSLQIAAWGFFTIVPLGIAVMAAQNTAPILPTSTQWALLVGATVIGTGAYYMLIMASRLGDMAVIAPFRYTRIVFALIVGIVVFDEADQINSLMLIGVLIIITSGIYTFYRQYLSRHASL
ncbi:hypothetical protein BVC71_05430 [Marivivens niveibacter]|uniref:EamA domain-containing protein n=1 Tax=Marivivens niveibacter TaxID=1930667 RepID=A0A251X3F3_9RHOB|nr:DMT family transporter [Marivivens niveibacter]OUD10908.1 hypothetical protein BVC71_05430 [Marivivens niveibacter]